MDPRLSPRNVQRYFDAHARDYDRQNDVAERRFLGRHRQWATTRATGSVVELAVGTGLNFPLYPDGVRVLGIDVSDGMLDVARARLATLGLAERMQVRLGDVQHLDLADASADTVLCCYGLCTVADPVAVLREAARILRPGGRLLLVEHGLGDRRWMRTIERLLNPLTLRWQAENLVREPGRLVREAGFEVTEEDQVGLGGIVYRIAARRPATS